MASSSSPSITHQEKYDVFLSFRGQDTRDNFTSHLYAALRRKQIETFIDYELKRGDEISPALLKAIEESKISVVVFSKDYASSKWCLDELVKILECKQRNGQMVVPVFYQVDPSHVRWQTGSFQNAFVQHEKEYKKMKEKVETWRAVLTEASNLSGWDSSKIRPESEFIDQIVGDILKKLKAISSSSDSNGLVGIRPRVVQIMSLLCIEESDFRTIGIWGMGGIGKTTIAGAIFNQISSQFEDCCFTNVKESENGGGLVHLRDEIFSKILGEDIKSIGTPSLSSFIKNRLQRKRVLIVLDDVINFRQLEFLMGGLDRLGPGSRIIITTRNKQVLCNYGVPDDNIYEVEGFNTGEALKLFCKYAFKQDHRAEDFMVLATEFVYYSKGNPLALKVLGSNLYRKPKKIWEGELIKLKKISNPQIYDVLISSFDGLDGEIKNIFLDIACFFKGEDKDFVAKILDNSYYSLDSGLIVLIDKALITISKNVIRMHDLIQEMGWEIVRKESQERGERSRLWNHEDVYHVLRKNRGTNKVEGVFLDMSKIRDIYVTSETFVKMCDLKFLKFYVPLQCLEDNSKVHLLQELNYLSDELRYLHWHKYPLKTLPLNFSPENLIQLNLPYSNIEQLWKGRKDMFKLKSIDLSHCQHLTEIPDFSDTAPQLEEMNLDYCTSLIDISSSIQNLNNLKTLSMVGCESLRSLQSNIHFGSPVTLDFSGCINLRKFSQISGNITYLSLRETGIEELPSSIGFLTGLEELDLEKCTRLKNLPTSICKLKSLFWLNLSDCSTLESLPEILEKMESLQQLFLDGTAIEGVPSSIGNLNGLLRLSLERCRNIETLPNSVSYLESLIHVAFSHYLKLDQLPENSENIKSVGECSFNRASITGLVLPPSSENLELRYCNLTEIPEDIGCLSSLLYLDLSGNNFETIPTSIKQLSHLVHLTLSDCNMLSSIPCLPLGLLMLNANNCKRLQSLPDLPLCLEQFYAPEMVDPYSFRNDPMDFMFINCPKLNQKAYNNTFAVSQLRIKHMAAVYEKAYGLPEINICIPGSDIPDWFSSGSFGSLLTIPLPHHWFNSTFIGFIICAVLAFEGSSYDVRNLVIDCECRFETNDGDWVDSHSTLSVMCGESKYGYPLIFESDHIVVGYAYDPDLNVELLTGDFIAGSFHFSLTKNIEELRKSCSVKYCGVCPLYADPDLTQSSISIEKLDATYQDFGETIVEEDTKIIHEEANASGTGSTNQDYVGTKIGEHNNIDHDDANSIESGISGEDEVERRPSSFCGLSSFCELCVFRVLGFLCKNSA